MEHTEIYTRENVNYLILHNTKLWESALHLKRSMGMTRDKNDKIDTYRISRHAITNGNKTKLVSLSNKTLILTKDLTTL
jgi:transposase